MSATTTQEGQAVRDPHACDGKGSKVHRRVPGEGLACRTWGPFMVPVSLEGVAVEGLCRKCWPTDQEGVST